MELMQLRYFMVVMEQRNITKAAKTTFTSQSNISKQISQLEKDLGVELFERQNIGVLPTPAGEYLYRGLTDLLPKLERLMDDVRDAEISDHKIIKLGVCESMDIERIVPHFFVKQKQHYPNIEIRISTHSFDKLLEKLSTNELDMIFFFSVLDVELPDAKRMPLTRQNPLIYFSKKHPLFQKENLTLSDFKNETFVRHTHRVENYNQYEALPFTPKKIIEANSLNAAFLYVETCAAVAMFGQSQSYLGKDSIATLEVETDDQKVGTDVVWLESNRNPALKQFLNLFAEYSPEHNRQD